MSAATETSVSVDFRYRGVRCRERIKLPPTPRNLAYAKNLLGQIKTEIAKGTFDYRKHFPDSPRVKQFAPAGAQQTMRELLTAWLDRKQHELEKSTLDGYRKIVDNVLIQKVGKIVVIDFTAGHARQLVTDLGDVSRKRVNNVLGPLRGALDDAVEQGLVPANPLHGMKFRKRKKVKDDDDIDPFTTAEIAAILAATDEPQYRNLVQFAASAGLRTSELIGLQWDDVDLPGRRVYVRRAFVEKQMKATKTEAGERTVDLVPTALQALEAQREHTRLAGKEVFQNPRKMQAWEHDQQIRNQFRRLLAKAEVRYRYPYQLRHTFASLALSAGENVMWVATQMGHDDWTVTAKKYARWIPSVVPDAGAKLAALWSTSGQREREIA